MKKKFEDCDPEKILKFEEAVEQWRTFLKFRWRPTRPDMDRMKAWGNVVNIYRDMKGNTLNLREILYRNYKLSFWGPVVEHARYLNVHCSYHMEGVAMKQKRMGRYENINLNPLERNDNLATKVLPENSTI
jgi:hypothetical protein